MNEPGFQTAMDQEAPFNEFGPESYDRKRRPRWLETRRFAPVDSHERRSVGVRPEANSALERAVVLLIDFQSGFDDESWEFGTIPTRNGGRRRCSRGGARPTARRSRPTRLDRTRLAASG